MRLIEPLAGGSTMATLCAFEVKAAEGSWLFTSGGSRLLDFYNGVGASNIGHRHPTWLRAVHEQMSTHAVGVLPTRVESDFADLLSEELPLEYSAYQLFTTGSEAVEAALKFVRGATGRTTVVSCYGGFHGKTAGSLGLHAGPRRRPWGPYTPAPVHIPFASELQGEAPAEESARVEQTLRAARRQIAMSCETAPAAIFVEPVQGTAGNVPPARDYLAGLRRLADEHEALLVFDEVITGVGRAGHMSSAHRVGVTPDVILFGKGLGSGYPVSAMVVTSAAVDRDGDNAYFEASTGSSTFGGNPIALAAASATLQVCKDEDLFSKGRTMGSALLEGLRSLQDEHPVVSSVHGVGAMLGLQLMHPGGEPVPAGQCKDLFRALARRGLLAMAYAPEIRLYPALNAADDEVSYAVDALGAALTDVFG